MLLPHLKKPRVYIPLVVIVVLAVLSAIVFHPAFQKKMLLDQVAPLVDSLAIERVHLTPWSLQVQGLAVRYSGGSFELREGYLGFCLSSLVQKTVSVPRVSVSGLRIDLKEFRPPGPDEPDSGPFEGLLALLDFGFGLRLDEVAIDAEVLLEGDRSVVARITGGGVRTEASGVLGIDLRLVPGPGDDHVDVRGDLTVQQLTGGKYQALAADLGLRAALKALPEPERVEIKARLSPAPPDTSRESPSPSDPAGKLPLAREALDLAIDLKDERGRDRATLGLTGIYDGSSGAFAGEYRLTANEHSVQPFMKDRKLPPAEQRLSGELALDTEKLTGEMTVKSDMKLSDLRKAHANDKLPAGLSIRNDLRFSLLPGNELRVETLDSGVFDDAERRALATRLPSEVPIRLDDKKHFLPRDRTLLELDLPEIPLAWFDVLFPDLDIMGGTLQAAFEIKTDASTAIRIVPTRPFRISGLAIRQGPESLVEGFDLSALPALTYTGKTLRLSLKDMKLAVRDRTLASASLDAVLSLSARKKSWLTAKAGADLYLDPLLHFDAEDRRGLPKDLSIAFEGALSRERDAIKVQALKASVSQGTQARVLQLELQKPLKLHLAGGGPILRDAAGELAAITLGRLDLGWLSAFLPDGRIAGDLVSGRLSVTGMAGGRVRVTTESPIRIGGLSLHGKDGPLIRNLDISLKPEIAYSPDSLKISYSDLSVKRGAAELVAAQGTVTLPIATGKRSAADGRFAVDLRALAGQPGIARILGGEIDSPLRLEADYGLARSEEGVDIQRLAANLLYADGKPRIALQSIGGLRVRTGPGTEAAPLVRATGRVILEIRDLSPEPFAKVLEARGLWFDGASGKAILQSDGTMLSLTAVEPFVLENVAVKEDGKDVLRPFSVELVSGATLRGDTLRARIDALGIAFAGKDEQPAVKAKADLSLRIEPGARLESLSMDLVASLPEILEQPALLPGHTLTAGEVRSQLRWYPSGRVQASTKIQGLAGKKDLALRGVDIPVDGQIRPDGTFSFSIPIHAEGKSGTTGIDVKLAHDQGTAEGTQRLEVDSGAVYLNDALATLRAIRGERGDEDGPRAGPTPEGANDAKPARSREPDPEAVWDFLPYTTHVDLDVDRLFYTDYLEIRDIKGTLELGPEVLALREWSAYFHDSPITVNGALRYAAGQASPYDLRVQAGIERLNLARFLRELVPGTTPRAEGLFDVKFDGFGSAPNLPQYRNDLFFDMRLQSRDGVFRPLEPDSVLIAGSSNFAGAFGEGVSYVPTGLFGLGAVSRLVNYIREIPYDRIDIQVVRDASRDLQIRRYLVQSPSILMTAKGGIDYRAGRDIIESPMSLTVQLDMRNKGAAILYSLDLLKPEKDRYGYWVGPEIKVGGTWFEPQSNLEEIISRAGRGALMGGVTRPVAGLWGNIKYDWMDKEEALEYKE